MFFYPVKASQMKGPRGNKLSCQPIYCRIKAAMKTFTDKLAKHEVEALKSQLDEDEGNHTEIEWGLFVKVKTKFGSAKFEAESSTEIDGDNFKTIRIEPSEEKKKETKLLNKQILMKYKNKEMGLGKEARPEEADENVTKVQKVTAPPAVSTTPKDKIRPGYNLNSGGLKRNIAQQLEMDESEDEFRDGLREDGDSLLGSANSKQPTKKARKISTPKTVLVGAKIGIRGGARGRTRRPAFRGRGQFRGRGEKVGMRQIRARGGRGKGAEVVRGGGSSEGLTPLIGNDESSGEEEKQSKSESDEEGEAESEAGEEDDPFDEDFYDTLIPKKKRVKK